MIRVVNYFALILFVFAACIAQLSAADPTYTPIKIKALTNKIICDPTDQKWVTQGFKLDKKATGQEQFGVVSNFEEKGSGEVKEKSYTVMQLEFADAKTCAKFKMPGTHIITKFGKFCDCFVEEAADMIDKLEQTPGLVWSEVRIKSLVPPKPVITKVKEKSRATPDAIVSGGYQGLTGKGVVVAVIDTGIDFRHKDFIIYGKDNKPTSRILAFWDLYSTDHATKKIGKPGPVNYPNGVPIGTIYSRDDLTAELRAEKPQLGEGDINGHGTACAGLAAGNGNASEGKYSGVAPNADIIMVRIGQTNMLDYTYLFGAITDWLFTTAGTRPLVVSTSWSDGFLAPGKGRDGYTIMDRQMDARFKPTNKGRAWCSSAGNNRDRRQHATFKFQNKGANEIGWSATNFCRMDIYVEASDIDDLHFELENPANADLDISSIFVNKLTNQAVIYLELKPGSNSLKATTVSGKDYTANAYFSLYDSASFFNRFVSQEKLIGSPGIAANAITVGSYNFCDTFVRTDGEYTLRDATRPDWAIEIGELSGYSSVGFRRFGDVIKPDLVAPGQWFTAPCPLKLEYADRDSFGQYSPFNGTSAATPYTAGVVALMLEKKPTLSLAEIKELLQGSVGWDRFTTKKIPNPKWGNGKFDHAAIERLFEKMNEPKEEKKE